MADNTEKEFLAQKLRELLKETQALHADNPMTEEEIAAQISAYRRGEREELLTNVLFSDAINGKNIVEGRV